MESSHFVGARRQRRPEQVGRGLHDRHGQDVNQHSDEGDQVIVLNDDAVDKQYERWQDPATVVRIKSPYLSC